MIRTNVYLDEEQLRALRAVSESRSESVAALVRQAVDDWLAENGVRPIPVDEWERRFDSLLERRERIARRVKPAPDGVERDIATAVAEVRSARRR
jgi:hypothetical protein